MKRFVQHGFTLIELSIVLVVMGLLISGIVVGKEMIYNAKLRKTLAQKEQFDAAVNTFKGKYNCLPGDCRSSTNLGLILRSVTTSGDGNGAVGVGVGVGFSNEYKLFWRHLLIARLVVFDLDPNSDVLYGSPEAYWPGVFSPKCPVCRPTSRTYGGYSRNDIGGWLVASFHMFTGLNCGIAGIGGPWTGLGGTLPYGNSWILSGDGIGGVQLPRASITHTDAQSIDRKIDDGKPMTGTVLAYTNYTYSDSACSGNGELMALHFYGSGGWGTTAYRSDNSEVVNMIFKAGF